MQGPSCPGKAELKCPTADGEATQRGALAGGCRPPPPTPPGQWEEAKGSWHEALGAARDR